MVRSHLVMHRNPQRALVALAAAGLFLAGCGGTDEPTPAATVPPTDPPASPTATATPVPTAAPASTSAAATDDATTSTALGDPVPAPALEGLMLPDRSTFDLATLKGQPTLVFFGYTHCPDVCPETLGQLFGVFEKVPDAQAVFVSVDPERDTPEFLSEWMKYKPENLHAVTGTPGAIRRAADGWGVKYARVETTSTAGYTMSHTADLYLLDEDGRLLMTYPFGTQAAEIIEDLHTLAAA